MTRLLLLFTLMLPLAALAQEPEEFQGIFCDTRTQIESVVKLGTELGGAAHGIAAVNASEPHACVFARILGVRGKEQAVIDSPVGKLGIVPFTIRLVQTPFGVVEAKEGTVWFTLADPVGTDI